MNSLILLHNKYPKNSANKNNIDNNRNSIDFDDNNEKLNNSFEKDNNDDKNKINNSYQISNSPNNIFDLSYIKNKNLYNMSNTKNQMGKYFNSYKRPTKRNYLEAFPQSKYEKNKNDDKTNVYNLNINNNNYFYINNKVYNVNSEEKYGLDLLQNKRFKEY